jgi:glycerate kinase
MTNEFITQFSKRVVERSREDFGKLPGGGGAGGMPLALNPQAFLSAMFGGQQAKR